MKSAFISKLKENPLFFVFDPAAKFADAHLPRCFRAVGLSEKSAGRAAGVAANIGGHALFFGGIGAGTFICLTSGAFLPMVAAAAVAAFGVGVAYSDTGLNGCPPVVSAAENQVFPAAEAGAALPASVSPAFFAVVSAKKPVAAPRPVVEARVSHENYG